MIVVGCVRVCGGAAFGFDPFFCGVATSTSRWAPRRRCRTASTRDGHQTSKVADIASGDSSRMIRFLGVEADGSLVGESRFRILSKNATQSSLMPPMAGEDDMPARPGRPGILPDQGMTTTALEPLPSGSSSPSSCPSSSVI